MNEPETRSNFLIPAAIVAAGVIVALAVVYTGGGFRARPNSPGTDQAGVASGEAAVAELADNDPVLGNPEAAVTIVEFADFQCPFCGRFFQTVEPEIIEQYVKTGKAKFVYRDFAFLGPESEWAAVAAECANAQGKFWVYHDYLYRNQQGENQGAFSKDNLKKFSRALGLDTTQFDSCLDADMYLEEIRADTAAGRAAGVNGTPTVFINGRSTVGALPFEQFKSIIDEALAGK